jgi:hypothetical protein
MTLHNLTLTWSHGFRESDCGIGSSLTPAWEIPYFEPASSVILSLGT